LRENGEQAATDPELTESQEYGSWNEDPKVAWRVDAMRARLPADRPLPRDLTILGLAPEAGRCPSCGDPQPYRQTGKCTLCCLASAAIMKERAWRDADR
jgi:hypothetical protein